MQRKVFLDTAFRLQNVLAASDSDEVYNAYVDKNILPTIKDEPVVSTGFMLINGTPLQSIIVHFARCNNSHLPHGSAIYLLDHVCANPVFLGTEEQALVPYWQEFRNKVIGQSQNRAFMMAAECAMDFISQELLNVQYVELPAADVAPLIEALDTRVLEFGRSIFDDMGIVSEDVERFVDLVGTAYNGIVLCLEAEYEKDNAPS